MFGLLRDVAITVAWLLESAELEVEYHITGGTVLGAVRDHDLVPHEWKWIFTFRLTSCFRPLSKSWHGSV